MQPQVRQPMQAGQPQQVAPAGTTTLQPAFPVQQQIARYQIMARTPGMAQQAQQLYTDLMSKLPEGAQLMSDGSVQVRPGASGVWATKAAGDKMFVQQPDGSFAPAPGVVASTGQMAEAQAGGTAAGQWNLEMAKIAGQGQNQINEQNTRGDNQRLTDAYNATIRQQPYLGPNNQPMTGYGGNVLGQPPMPPMMGPTAAPRMPVQGQPLPPLQGAPQTQQPQGQPGGPLQIGGAMGPRFAMPAQSPAGQPAAPLQLGGALPGINPQAGAPMQPGASPGAPASGVATGLGPQGQKIADAYGAQGADTIENVGKARDLQTRVGLTLRELPNFETGTFGEQKAAAGRVLAGLGASPDFIRTQFGDPASADLLQKNLFKTAMEQMQGSMGSSREALGVVNQFVGSNANLSTQPHATAVMLNVINQAAQRQIDRLPAQESWLQDPSHNGSLAGFDQAFAQSNPPQQYVENAYKSAYGLPPNAVRLPKTIGGRPVYQVGGKMVVVQ